LKDLPPVRDEFRGQSLASLQSDLGDIQSLIRLTPIDVAIAQGVVELSKINSSEMNYLGLFFGVASDDLKESDLPALKAIEPKAATIANAEINQRLNSTLQPYCTIQGAFLSLWSNRGQFLIYNHNQVGNWQIILPPATAPNG
jgi:hypothetical protein